MARAVHASGPRGLIPEAVACGLAALLATLGPAACFKPGIEDGGFACAKAGKPCPDGFQCAFNNRCYRDISTVSDAGEKMCSAPPPAPSCQDDPRSGELCNPTCQKGCECNRCNVLLSTGHAACVPAGPAKLGDLCKPGADDNCGAGLICLKETCGNNLGRCYKHCTTNDQCNGSVCTVSIADTRGQDTGYKTCDVPPTECDPVNNTGCPSPAFNCYVTSASLTLCDCPGPNAGGKNGDACTYYRDCAPGYVCIGVAGGSFQCRFACSVANPACPVGSTCTAMVGKYGFCS
jgi:hypothetical protein